MFRREIVVFQANRQPNKIFLTRGGGNCRETFHNEIRRLWLDDFSRVSIRASALNDRLPQVPAPPAGAFFFSCLAGASEAKETVPFSRGERTHSRSNVAIAAKNGTARVRPDEMGGL
jgi:hypothetical protein